MRFEGSWESPYFGPMTDGRHGRRRFLGMGGGEKESDEYEVEAGGVEEWGMGRGFGVGVVGSWGNRCRCVQTLV